MQKLLIILLVTIGICSVIATRYTQIKYAAPFVPNPSSFTLTPPPSALTGIITSIIGNAEKMGRDDTEYQETSPSAQLLQGESITTKSYSEAILELDKTLIITMGPFSEIDLVNLLANNLTFRQKSGRITYELMKDEFPLSVRALETLINIDSGQTTIEIRGNVIILSVLSGSADVACIDLDNNTKEWTVSERQTRRINNHTCYLY